jgi:hypothetical protein
VVRPQVLWRGVRVRVRACKRAAWQPRPARPARPAKKRHHTPTRARARSHLQQPGGERVQLEVALVVARARRFGGCSGLHSRGLHVWYVGGSGGGGVSGWRQQQHEDSGARSRSSAAQVSPRRLPQVRALGPQRNARALKTHLGLHITHIVALLGCCCHGAGALCTQRAGPQARSQA